MADDVDDEVIAAVRAMHAAGGRPLSAEEEARHLAKSPTLIGDLRPKEEPRRGPKTKRTIYDDALDRRKNLYRLAVKLPKRNSEDADVEFLRDAVEQVVGYLGGVRVTPGQVARAWANVPGVRRGACPSNATIRRRLEELRKAGKIAG